MTSAFHVDPKLTTVPSPQDEGMLAASRQCGRVSRDPTSHWIAAASADTVVKALAMLDIARRAILAGRLQATGAGAIPDGNGAAIDEIDFHAASDGSVTVELDFSNYIAVTLKAHIAPGDFIPTGIDSAQTASYIIVT